VSGIIRVSPEEAQTLVAEGYVYVDVRTELEFEQGHAPGALNVPVMLQGPTGMVPNPDFPDVMQAAFGRGEPLLLGCRSGVRSMKAAQQLVGLGYTNLRELRTGWEGTRDAFGRLEPGWGKKGLPVELGAPAGQSYQDVKQRTPR